MTPWTIAACLSGGGRRPFGLVWRMGSPLALVAACGLGGLRLNLTGSLPVGVYLAFRAAPVRGTLVLACLPPEVAAFAKARGYVPRGIACAGAVAAVGKAVVAIVGDTVTVTPAGLVVNGAAVPNSLALASDRKGRRLPQLGAGRYVVEPGTVWIVSSYSRFSFDSRYFGAIQARQIRANLQRLWTAGLDR